MAQYCERIRYRCQPCERAYGADDITQEDEVPGNQVAGGRVGVEQQGTGWSQEVGSMASDRSAPRCSSMEARSPLPHLLDHAGHGLSF